MSDAESPWQPIATAPRDGTAIIAYWPHLDKPVVAWLFRGHQWIASHNTQWRGKMANAPTHWMPLPSSPSKEKISMPDKMVTCIRCEKEMRNFSQRGYQPDNGLAFYTSGHYGSRYFDPMNGSYLELCICDECVEAADKLGRVHHYEAGTRETKV